MAVSYSDPFSGSTSTTCSVSVAYAVKHAQGLKDRGLTEAAWQEQKHLGTWGVVKGKLQAGTAPDLPFAVWKLPDDNIAYKIRVKNGKILAHNTTDGSSVPISNLDLFEDNWVKIALDEGDWEWLGVHAPKPGPVSVTSDSVGALTDLDAATLFVKTKDKIAAEKGINIKGANPLLDNEVFQAIANETGYTAVEVKAKVNAYKASGKKLSALKKKALPKKAPTVKPPNPPSQPPVNVEVPDTSAVPSNQLPDLDSPDPEEVAKRKANFLKGLENDIFTLDDMKFFAENSKNPATKKAAQEVLDGMNGPTSVVPATLPTAVPTTAADDVVSAATQAISDATPTYLDEQVAKAYIKAKDQLAASPSNPWTLYTQNNAAFEDAILNLMAKSYDIDLTPDKMKAQIANYIATQKKLSVLKKQMAKTGEYAPQADSLKKKKGDPGTVGTQSKTAAQQTIADAADAGYVPDGAVDYTLLPNEYSFIFNNLSSSVYAGMDPATVYGKFDNLKTSWAGYFGKTDSPSVLQIVRAYDEQKAAQLGIPNGNFYEKKVVEYAASPAGQAQIKAQKDAAELLANLPPLPADSAGYQAYSVSQARELQKEMTASEPWNASHKDGLRTYTGGSYRDMNYALRHDQTPSQTSRNAQAGMRPTTRQLLVHRGTGFSQFGVHSFEEVLQLVGKTVQDKGFVSTSVGGRGAFGGEVNMEIEVPKGTHAAFVKDISLHTHEDEFLLAAGTQYEVLTVTKSGYQTTVRVRAIPGSHSRF